MNLKRLRYFVAVAEELHFGRAAARLNVVQPAISQQIKLLEEEIGAALLERSSRRVALTAAGKALLAEARHVVQQVELARQAVRDAITGHVGTLRIGFVDNAIWSAFPRFVRDFRERYPSIELILSQMPRPRQLAMLDSSELDLALVPGPVLRPGIATLEFARAPLWVAVATGHRLASQEAIRIESLANEPFIALPAANDPRRINEVIFHLCGEAGFVPILGQAVEQMHTTLSLVSAGLGVGVIPEWMRRAWSDNIEYRPLLPRADYALVACYRHTRSSPMITAFLATIKDWIQVAPAAIHQP